MDLSSENQKDTPRVNKEAKNNSFDKDYDSLDPDSLDQNKDESSSEIQTVVYSIPVDHLDTSIYLKGWLVKNSHKPPIIFVHDLGENIGFYRKAAHYLCKYGYCVYGYDLRGHGRSGQMLGHIPKFEVLLKDLLQVVAWVKFKSGRKTPYVIGQGIGSLITVYFQKVFPSFLKGSVLVSPIIISESYPGFSLRLFIKLLAEILPTIHLPRFLTPKFLTQRIQVKKSQTATKASILSSYRITVNFAKEMIVALTGAQSAFYASKKQSLILYPIKSEFSNYEEFNKLLLHHPRTSLIRSYPLEESPHNVLSGNDKLLFDNLDIVASWLEEKQKEAAKKNQ